MFRDAFRVADIAEGLVSFDAELPGSAALEVLERRRFVVAGVREGGVVTGYVLADDLRRTRSTCGACRREFDADEVVPDGLALATALRRLASRDRIFVTAFGRVAGIVTWSDLQKPVVRMWLFGLVTLLEIGLTSMVDLWFGREDWQRLLSPARVRRAEELLADRRRQQTGSALDLLDCLQFGDKAVILLKHAETRRLLGMASKEAGERAFRRVSRLRDNLAHSQDIVSDDWEVILALTERMDQVLALGATMPRRWRSGRGGAARSRAPRTSGA